MIEARELVKWYGPTLAVDSISFEIPEGEIVGFLGPNGAGKSTAIRILTGYLPPTSGGASVHGHDVLTQPAAARAAIGYLPESTPLYGEMRVEEYLDFRGRLFSMPRARRRERIAVVCERCGLSRLRRRVVAHLSKGNRQRLGLAQALLHEPPVLILDEPAAGLDPNQIGEVRRLIRELRGKHTVLLSSHILPEVEKTADRVLIIAGGQIVAQGSPAELRQRVRQGGKVLVEAKMPASELHELLKTLPAAHRAEVRAEAGWSQAVVTPDGDADLREPVGQALAGRSVPVRELRHLEASLEEYFAQITGQTVAAPAGVSPAEPEPAEAASR
ncbi:MAG: ABC transporter ATP-binding protein [Phycisphaeraceae bacterium]